MLEPLSYVKYIDIVVDALMPSLNIKSCTDKLFSQYIFIFHGLWLHKIWMDFFMHVTYLMLLAPSMYNMFSLSQKLDS
jgi:hypothetical protein